MDAVDTGTYVLFVSGEEGGTCIRMSRWRFLLRGPAYLLLHGNNHTHEGCQLLAQPFFGIYWAILIGAFYSWDVLQIVPFSFGSAAACCSGQHKPLDLAARVKLFVRLVGGGRLGGVYRRFCMSVRSWLRSTMG